MYLFSGCDDNTVPKETIQIPVPSVSLEPAPSIVPPEQTAIIPISTPGEQNNFEPSSISKPTGTTIPASEPTVKPLLYEVTRFIEEGAYKLPMSQYNYVKVYYACMSIINTNVKSGTFNIWFSDIPPLKELEEYPVYENFHSIVIEPYQSTRVCCPSNDHPGSWTYQI